MKQFLILVLKGMLIGIGKVIPGVSGSLIAVSLGVYEKAIEAIGNFFKNIKENILFLGTLAIGIVFSIAFGSKIIIYLLEIFYVPTLLLFVGFIAGVLPSLYHKIGNKNKRYYFYFMISFLFVFFLDLCSSNANFYPEKNLLSYLLIVGIGFLDAATMIIPGISGTAIFIILGCYSFVLNLFSSISSVIEIFSNFDYLFSFGIGLLIGIIAISHLINYMLKNNRDTMYALIMGFTSSSIFVLIEKALEPMHTGLEFIIGIFLAYVGYRLSIKFEKE